MPNKYYIDRKNNLRQVPKEKEADFLKKYPGSREATSKELSDFEDMMFRKRQSNEGEAGIQKEQNNSTAKLPANNPLMGNQFGFDVPNYSEQFKPENYKIDLRQPDNTPTKIFSGDSPFARPSKDGVVADAMKKLGKQRRESSDFIVQSTIDEYESYKRWIDEVNRDPDMSEKVKKELNDWYNQNFRDTNNSTDDVRVPSLVRDYLEKNKKEVSKSIYVPGSPMFGGGTWTEGTVEENSPEQMAMIADFLANSPKGRLLMEDEKLYLQRLDESIDSLEKKIQDTSVKRRELLPQTLGMKEYLMLPRHKKKELEETNNALRDDVEKQYPFADLMNSQNQLNELKKLRKAYNDGDKGAIKQLAKELGRRLPYDLANAGSFGTIGLTDQEALSKALSNPNNKLTREAYNLVAEYQQAHEIDRSIAQDIARGTTETLPFITQFVATGGVTSTVGRGLVGLAPKLGITGSRLATIGSGIDKTSRLGKGLTTAGNVGKTLAADVLDAGARSLIMPTTYADALARTTDNQGSFLDNFAHSWFVNTIENYSEKFGAHLPGWKVSNPKLKKAMDITGVQGFPEEFAEEQLGMVLNSLFETGEAEWSDLVDPRNQLITAGTIGMIQIPYLSIRAGGYSAAKFRNVRQKRSINKGYKENLLNMEKAFGEEASAMTSFIDESISSINNDEDLEKSINGFMLNVMNDAELSEAQKDAVLKYTMASLAKSSLETGKAEQIQQAQEEATQRLQENINPQMNAVVSAVVAGFGLSTFIRTV